jgi:hypothetical protein
MKQGLSTRDYCLRAVQYGECSLCNRVSGNALRCLFKGLFVVAPEVPLAKVGLATEGGTLHRPVRVS